MRINNKETSKFSASTVHLEHITTALNCLTPFGSKEDVLIYIDADGLSFLRENNHIIRIQLFLSRELFLSYMYECESEENMKLCVKINHILDSVGVANRNLDDIVECTLSYNGYGSPFVLIFEDSLISERVEYSTYLIKGMDNTGLELDRNQLVLECIIKGDVLYTALKDLKEIGCKECFIYAKSDAYGDNVFSLISKSQLGYSKIKFPSNRSILEKLQVYDNDSTTVLNDVPVIGFFDFSSFDKIRMSTKIASKVLFRMDIHGLLSVSILSQTDDVVITATRYSNKQGNSDVFNNMKSKQKQLPKDYPGIVIEVCMLEKESIDEVSQNEIVLLMQSNESGELINDRVINVQQRKHVSIDHDFGDGHLLGLGNKKIRLQKQGKDEETNLKDMPTKLEQLKKDEDNETKTQDPNHFPPSTNDIPLFF